MMQPKNQTVALTGGTGFLGYHLVYCLLDAGYRVRLLNRAGSKHPLVTTYPLGVEVVEVDLSREDRIERALCGVSSIVHCAGLVSYQRKDTERLYEVHVNLTKRMLSAARKAGVRRFVHVSSIVALGHGLELRDETAIFNAQDLDLHYWTTKYESEQIALAAVSKDFEVVVVNPGTLVGYGEKYGHARPLFEKLRNAKWALLPDGGSDFLDAVDAAKGTVLALERGRSGQRYILGSENLTYADMHQRLRNLNGSSAVSFRIPRWVMRGAILILKSIERLTGLDLPLNSSRLTRVNGIFMFHDISKAKRELGYSPHPIDDCLRQMFKEKRK